MIRNRLAAFPPAGLPSGALAALALAGFLLAAAPGCAVGLQGAGSESASGDAARGSMAGDDAKALDAVLGWPLELDPGIRTGELDNGLKYFIRENVRPENRADLWLALNAGSMQEDDDQQGLAHFVEHMAFNGTERFEKQEIVDYLELIGMRFGPDVNAFTSFDETVYMLKIPMDDPQIVTTAFEILQDWASAVTFDGAEIDKERGVVLEEWRLGRGAGARMRDQQFPVLFKGSRYAERLTIGKPEIIQNAPHEAFRRFYRDWYRPDLMAVIAVGDFDPDAMEEMIRTHFSDLENPENARDRVVYPVPDHAETLVTVATDPEATRSTVSVYTKLERRPTETVGDFRRNLLEVLYHSMLNARLDEIRQQPDPPFLFAYSTTGSMVRSKDVFVQSAGVRGSDFAPALERLLVEIERVDRHGFTPTELERAKADILRGLEQAFKERDKRRSRNIAGEILGHFLDSEPAPGIEAELEMARELLPGIGLDELNDLASEWIGEENRVLTVSAPQNDEITVPSENKLLAVFRAAEATDVDPYVDRVRDAPLVEETPRPATVVTSNDIAALGVTVWSLSNGVEVVLKPTDFKNDQILLSGFSPGGHSLVPDAEHPSAVYASGALRAGGLGEFDRVELEKALTGKVARASAWIGELEEGISASASPEDAETMFQLIYLLFTAPREDAGAFDSWMTRTREFVRNRNARPETVFSDRMTETMAQGHPRRRPVSTEMLDEIDLQVARRVYEDRFANAADFTFVLVGNFDPEGIEPLVTTWLGGLPATGRDEVWRDVGVEAPAGVETFEVRKGLEPKSSVRIVFTTDAEWSRQNQHDIRSLASALRIRLREILREDMGGVYGVGVYGSISLWPRERSSFTVSFGCSPENVDSLVDAVFDEIRRIQAEGVDRTYIDKVREGQRRARETDLKENGFWMGALSSAWRYDHDPLLLLAYEELVESVVSARIRDAARRYIDTDHYVLGVLKPEEGIGRAPGDAPGEGDRPSGLAR